MPKGNKMKNIVLIITILILSCDQSTEDFLKMENQIQSILDQQKQAWNEGNIEGFMAYYWRSKDFTFQSGNKRLEGWDELLAMYKKNYSGENMGRLDFSDIEVNVLSREIACVLGRWKVTTNESSKEGLFTLIFKKFDEGWRIIVDHSS